MTYNPEGPDVLGAVRWHGIDGIIIPSSEGYGVIPTADSERIVITVPLEVTNRLDKDTPRKMAEALLEPMFIRISEMLSDLHEKSKGPE